MNIYLLINRIRKGMIVVLSVSATCAAMGAKDFSVGSRQVHLDFHTSEKLPEIGKHFSKKQFQAALIAGNVNAINIFAKGHHSWSYYPTKVGEMHPNLDFDLLGAQIEACHEIGLLAPIYYTFGWSHIDAVKHPEWCARRKNGDVMTTQPYDFEAPEDTPKPNFHWIHMCVNTSYHDHIMEQIEEICLGYPVDGFWFDIYQVANPCYCETCRKLMKESGYDVENKQAVHRFQGESFKRHQRALTELVHQYHPEATLYFNGCTSVGRGAQNFKLKMYEYNTVQDLEDLPTTWGGYDKLPMQSKFFLSEGYPITAMSGKFHKAWGEFGGFKHPNALTYEAASMIAWGANCNFGDQLHPSGEMDMETYRTIGVAYDYVEKIEAYGVGGIPAARVAIWRSFSLPHDEGLSRMLLDANINFSVANAGDRGLSQYDVIILPGVPCTTAKDVERLNRYVADGGKLLLIGQGALDKGRTRLQFDTGAEYLGAGQYDKDYLVAAGDLQAGLVSSPFLCYKPALRVKPEQGTEILASVHEPYFSRTYGAFTSHQNTPFQLEPAAHPGALRKDNIILLTHDLDEMYYKHGSYLHRDFFANVLGLFHEQPMVEVDLPSVGRVSLLHQPEDRRYVVHLLYGPPVTRGACEVIEDLPTLFNVEVKIDLPVSVKRALWVPEMKELPISEKNGKLSVTVPQFSCHSAIAFEYTEKSTDE